MAPLPFDKVCDVLAQGGTAVAEGVPCSNPWPVTSRGGDVGQEHDHEAQLPVSAFALVDVANRKLDIEGKRYSITRAYTLEFLPHVQVELRRVSG